MKSRVDYVKVMLYAFPRLGQFSEACGCAVENKAILSYRRTEGALALMEEIVSEIALKEAFAQLDGEIKDTLQKLNREEQYLLEYKFFRRKGELRRLRENAPRCSERTYFRKQNALLNKVFNLFTERGMTEEWFWGKFGGFSPFCRAYKNVQLGKDRAFGRRKGSYSSSSRSAVRLPFKTSTVIATAESANATRKKI